MALQAILGQQRSLASAVDSCLDTAKHAPAVIDWGARVKLGWFVQAVRHYGIGFREILMRAAINDFLRTMISATLQCAGAFEEARHRSRIQGFQEDQRSLRQRFGISDETPLVQDLPTPDASEVATPGAHVALTSGTSSEPKRVLYTARRLRAVRNVFVASFLRCFWILDIRRTSLYVFGSLEPDSSLTSLLLAEQRRPPLLSLLQAPYRIHAHPALRRVAAGYGTAAVRLWVLAVSNPGVLYSTNPSTLFAFFEELRTDWAKSTELVRQAVRDPQPLDPEACRLVRRLASRGWEQRLERIATSPQSLPISEWAPAVRAYACWTGGYVGPFLNRLQRHLPSPPIRRVDMYSMSTEAVETIPNFRRTGVQFLPLAPDTHYEFLDIDVPESAGEVLSAHQLRNFGFYEMIVSHPYALTRYRTGDVFLCDGFVSGVPSLRFVQRRNLGYSFTGEKLTATQVEGAIRELQADEHLAVTCVLTCFPSEPRGASLPCYRLVAVRMDRTGQVPQPEIASRFDYILRDINLEYKSKRDSKRLGEVRFESIEFDKFRQLVQDRDLGQWDSQFKFLPLYPRLWESLRGE